MYCPQSVIPVVLFPQKGAGRYIKSLPLENTSFNQWTWRRVCVCVCVCVFVHVFAYVYVRVCMRSCTHQNVGTYCRHNWF